MALLDERMQQVFQEVLGVPRELADPITPEDIPSWDSLTHIKLITALEQEFGMRFTTRQAASIECVGDLKAILHNAGA